MTLYILDCLLFDNIRFSNQHLNRIFIQAVFSVDIVKKYLEDRIVRGIISPGQKIKEEEVARELRISRPPIKEAFKLLEAAGAVVRFHNVFIRLANHKRLMEILLELELQIKRLMYESLSDAQ